MITYITTASQKPCHPFLLIKKIMALLSVTAQLRLLQGLCVLGTTGKLMLISTHTDGLELT